MALLSRTRHFNVGIACLILFVGALHFHRRPFSYDSFRLLRDGIEPICKNRTLGFQEVVVVSTGASARLDGLYDAAAFTEFDVEVPVQPKWLREEVDHFRGVGDGSRRTEMGPGEAQCWLGHLNALHHVIDKGYSTALIMEDDADWDIEIKEQLTLLAPMIQNLSHTRYPQYPPQFPPRVRHDSPYGNDWDLLWVGHCGDHLPTKAFESIFDETLPDSPVYRENTGEYIEFPWKLRMVHPSKEPICTYAYAVTQNAARQIYDRSYRGMDRVITKHLTEWCLEGVLRCFTVNPELFHHHKTRGEVSSQIAVIEGWDELAAPAAVEYTPNIRYSARCNSHSSVRVRCQSEFGDDELR